MNRYMTGKKNHFGKVIITAIMLSMLVVRPVYATEDNPQPAAEEQAAPQEQPAEEQPAQEQPAEEGAAEEQPAEEPAQEAPAAATTNRTTRRSSRTGSSTAASSAASSASSEASSAAEEASDDSLLGVSVPDLEVTNGKYTLTLKKNANMRSEPSTDAESRIVIPFGMELSSDSRVVNQDGETWYEVTYAMLTGYIREDLADVETISIETPEETEEGAEGEGEEASEENTEEAGDDAATGAATTAPAVTPHSVINSEKNDQAQEESAASLVNSAQTDETVKVKSRKKFDFVVLMFLVLAGIGVALIIVVLNGLRIEVRRASEAMQKYKKKEKQKLFQNIEE